MENFEIHFNTAATRTYGIMILALLKHEITRNIEIKEELPENKEKD